MTEITWRCRLTYEANPISRGGARMQVQVSGQSAHLPAPDPAFLPVRAYDNDELAAALAPLAADLVHTLAGAYRHSPAAGAKLSVSMVQAFTPRGPEALNRYTILLMSLVSAAARAAERLVHTEAQQRGETES